MQVRRLLQVSYRRKQRHTAASIAVHSGANVKALQRMLGHKSAAMTLDRYADLFDKDLDTVSAAVEKEIAKALR